MHCVFLGYLGDLCAIHIDDIPYLRIIDGGHACAVSDVQTCDAVHIYSTFFAVNPSFSCRVVVSIARHSKKQCLENMTLLTLGHLGNFIFR